MGEKIVEKIIIKTKSEMNSTLPPNSHTSIRSPIFFVGLKKES